ncbi:tRNA (N(6)-L-threonylcarbamoyladenosine(37)-C(2))-methylthiotransferase MtaB [Acuticoccus kandeliae]|uniref:tRNA (N(6)-L-threonylcarbamoyladenosine(37)-C(2))- methylthiotransferase MtaB n=1 Tax=Acuticoccus kandeliae TaxID=2073160 RepID=UPI001FE491DC|nr:tRNA (N(6)-L-threonylcarbamoyladenosine(37)-C(2))-methylthiotransferase MtaB [Acuticoccus kandeliae]
MTNINAPSDLDIVTFGCRLNALESENVRALAADAGVTDTVVVNTCAVTAEAVRQARQTIRKIRRERPNARIIATGCAAQTDPDGFAAMDEIDHVVGNAEKLQPAFWANLPRHDKIVVGDIMDLRETAAHLVESFGSRTRAFVEVQNGCDHRCTFCIIPYGRGPSRSVPMGVVVDQVKRLVDSGHREVVLTGVDLTSYGGDLPGAPKLGDLVARILRLVPDLPRLRLSSIDSIEVDPALLDVIGGEPRLMPHLHLSLQAGDDMVLKRMKRRHLREDAVRFCAEARARRPDLVFGADLIAGFPTETDAMFENTLAILADCDLTHVHVFPFSARVGTPAARMPQVARQVVKARAARLREAAEARLAGALAGADGSTVELLVEDGNRGRTPHYLPAHLVGTPVPAGDLLAGRVVGAEGGSLLVERLAA